MKGTERLFRGFPLLSWTVAAFLVVIAAASGACSFDGEPDGYGELAWGTPVSELKGMVFARPSAEREGMAVYRRFPEVLRYGEAVLESVEYEFWKDRLARVSIRVKDLYNFILLREALFRRHGKGRELSPQSERYAWEGPVTRMTLLSNFDIS